MSREDQSYAFLASEPTSGLALHNKTNLSSLDQTHSSGVLTRRFAHPVVAGLREKLRVRSDERCGNESTKREVTRRHTLRQPVQSDL